ncbi:hypothetical protein, partial [uncultured Agrococcus sp.]|uniref:hypothetical protein n=1 Tax=uncultured Agrococcus sp. TaxID=382258 RepID=UPI0025FE3753
SIPADYVIDGRYSVAGLRVPNAWGSGDTVTAHVCIDHDDVRILDADGTVLNTEPTSRFTASTVLFELSEDEDMFLVADILNLFPDASDPCPAA